MDNPTATVSNTKTNDQPAVPSAVPSEENASRESKQSLLKRRLQVHMTTQHLQPKGEYISLGNMFALHRM